MADAGGIAWAKERGIPTEVVDHKPFAGDRAAFVVWAEAYMELVHSIAWANAGNLHGGDPVARNSFLEAFDTLGRFQGGVEAGPLLVRIVRRRAAEHRRSDVGHGGHALSTMAWPYAMVRALEQIAPLPVDVREVVLLHDGFGWDTAAIGRALGIRLHTVEKRLERANRRLTNKALFPAGTTAVYADALAQLQEEVDTRPEPDWGSVSPSDVSAVHRVKNALQSLVQIVGIPELAMILIAVMVGVAGMVHLMGSDDDRTTKITRDNKGPSRALRRPNPLAEESADEEVSGYLVGRVSGTVQDGEGKPLAGADLLATSHGGAVQGAAVSGEDGTYSVPLTVVGAPARPDEMRRLLAVTCRKAGFTDVELPDVRMGAKSVDVVMFPVPPK